jgi:hypothetical protein
VGLILIVGALAIALASPVIGGSPGREKQQGHFGEHPGCHGTANAYSHVLANAETDPEARQSLEDLQAVADKKGCDLSGVEPASKPNRDGENQPDEVTDGNGGPPADVVAAKCDRIAGKIETAAGREHGNSAAAFARQADKWSCPD